MFRNVPLLVHANAIYNYACYIASNQYLQLSGIVNIFIILYIFTPTFAFWLTVRFSIISTS